MFILFSYLKKHTLLLKFFFNLKCNGLIFVEIYYYLLSTRPHIFLFVKVLDACAAPGNKTIQLAAIMDGKGEITACELNDKRVLHLKDTIKRSGASSILYIFIFK